MSAHDVQHAISSPPIPRPRGAGADAAAAPAGPAPTQAAFPWPERWRSADGARPTTEYWDVTTACWHSHAPQERPGD
jgi:hypothetical protein